MKISYDKTIAVFKRDVKSLSEPTLEAKDQKKKIFDNKRKQRNSRRQIIGNQLLFYVGRT
ncbi:hypothetical protein BB561_004598 [Smittium simulii]|uniref:Uncharacterized protein n=1 Tax=Smittium simulii TaxID=133385 RepID=A0A2T9YFA3_9FUNG|nr:hypothetical protein BB561_004598 [Smittium simulii]